MTIRDWILAVVFAVSMFSLWTVIQRREAQIEVAEKVDCKRALKAGEARVESVVQDWKVKRGCK